LKSVSEIETPAREIKTGIHVMGNQQNMSCVAMGSTIHQRDIRLLRPCRQTSGGAAALDDKKYAWNLGIVGETDGFVHQRDSRAGSGGHCAGSRPPRTGNHACRRDLIFRLYDSIGSFAVLGVAQPGQVVLHGLSEGARWGDRIPTNDGGSTIDRPQCRSGVALGDDFAFVAVRDHLQPCNILREGFLPYILVAGVDTEKVRLNHCRFLSESVLQDGLDNLHIDAE
jgi:hypothetical protein